MQESIAAIIEINISNATATASEHVWGGRLFNCIIYAEVNNTLTEEFSLLSSVAVMRGKPEMLDNRYLAFFLNSDRGRQSMLSLISGVAITRLTLTKLNSALIPLPPLTTQQAIVAEIEAEQALVASNRELIARFEKKIQATLARVWGEEPSVCTR